MVDFMYFKEGKLYLSFHEKGMPVLFYGVSDKRFGGMVPEFPYAVPLKDLGAVFESGLEKEVNIGSASAMVDKEGKLIIKNSGKMPCTQPVSAFSKEETETIRTAYKRFES